MGFFFVTLEQSALSGAAHLVRAGANTLQADPIFTSLQQAAENAPAASIQTKRPRR